MSTKIFSAAALLAVVGTATAASSSVTVVNGCSFPAYYAISQGGSADTAAKAIPAGQPLTLPIDGDAYCLKLAPTQNIGSSGIAQIEFSVDTQMWYDLSNINGNPFYKWGYTLTPSESSCTTLTCAPTDNPDQQCTAAYNLPDDHGTHSCPVGSTTTLHLCTSGGSSSGSGSGSGSGSSAPSSSAPVYKPSSSAAQVQEAAKQPATQAPAATHTTAPAAPKVSPKVEQAPSNGSPVHIDSHGNAYVEVAKPVYYTTFVTMQARDAEATAAPVVERSEHQGHHGHAHAHNNAHRRL